MKIKLPKRKVSRSLVSELKASIQEHGQYHNILIDRTGYIIDGLHRYIAMLELNYKTVKATLLGNGFLYEIRLLIG